ncbi:uncharacterized protein EV422DRAFT_494728 [Fimicolochytrium jonesii]|uniref:uncharacterized protein n=1 Tax=Fimicolochytrium jonesii TaxID=1396493 RepID=UPI0022FEB991|nr:uncharacterized protein EV422DRAFT_494728 [Fimicolochytrium jonesii]KAI8822641.1 hypothetical protein EV422DRAFT_494728 [Fimicolochytrium jonesii]
MSSPRSIAVFSGGSAVNAFVSVLQGFTDDMSYIMPVSDDGGSTSEIIKVLGGPGIGDLRSRVVRLAETSSFESKAVRDLLSYRLPCDDPSSDRRSSAKAEWLDILEGSHPLWDGISHPYRETIRTFLAHFQHELVKSSTRRPPFNFEGGSIGNFFLTGSRLFFDNLDAAVFQFMRIMRVPPRTEVVPVLETNRGSVMIAAALRDGTTIFGQCEISHPGNTGGSIELSQTKSLDACSDAGHDSSASSPAESDFSAHSPPSRTCSQNLFFNKGSCQTLCSPIRRIYYVNREHQEIFPDMNPLISSQLSRKRTIVYGCGSLYTSILPCLVVPGVGRLLADPGPRQLAPPYPIRCHLSRVKILMLNGSYDRETSCYTALDFIFAITDALNYSCIVDDRRSRARRTSVPDIQGYINPFDRDKEGKPVGLEWWVDDHHSLEPQSMTPPDRRSTPTQNENAAYPIRHATPPADEMDILTSTMGRTYLGSPYQPGAFMTHMLYPEDGSIPVEVDRIEALGIRCVRVKKPMVSTSIPHTPGFYDPEELSEVLDHLIV